MLLAQLLQSCSFDCSVRTLRPTAKITARLPSAGKQTCTCPDRRAGSRRSGQATNNCNCVHDHFLPTVRLPLSEAKALTVGARDRQAVFAVLLILRVALWLSAETSKICDQSSCNERTRKIEPQCR